MPKSSGNLDRDGRDPAILAALSPNADESHTFGRKKELFMSAFLSDSAEAVEVVQVVLRSAGVRSRGSGRSWCRWR